MQTYYDNWSLTGLNVRENRGTDYAMVYEDPAATTLNVDASLVAVAMGLDGLSERARLRRPTAAARVRRRQARYHDQRSRRGPPKLEDRFDRTRNGSATDTSAGASQTLRVVTRSYSHRDAAVVNIGSVEANASSTRI